jgi:signal transduction histidine kinase
MAGRASPQQAEAGGLPLEPSHGSGSSREKTLERRGLSPGDLDALLRAAHFGVAKLDQRGRLSALNEEAERLLGGDDAEIVDRTLEQVAPAAGAWDSLLDAARTHGLAKRTITPDDSSRGQIEATVWRADQGDPAELGLVVTELIGDGGIASLSDRAHLAREIHDGLAQDLWLAKLTATRLQNHATLDEEGQTLVAELLRCVDASLAEATAAVTAMRQPTDRASALSALVERQVEEFADRFGLRVDCEIDESVTAPPHVAAEVLRIVQEAMNNVRKHAGARRIQVRLRQPADTVEVAIVDDGIGFDPAGASPGFGRESMARRASSIGGTLRIQSSPGSGTEVRLLLPNGARAAVP